MNQESKARQELQTPSKEYFTRHLTFAQRDLISFKLKISKERGLIVGKQ